MPVGKKSFLIVDKAEITEVIIAELNQRYTDSLFFTARDGSEAFHKMQNAPPSVVIMELDLPKVSALALLERIRKIDALEKTPVVLMTSRERDDELVEKCLEKSCIYLMKPFKTPYLAGIVEGLLLTERPALVEKHMTAGEILFREGDPCGCLYLVKSGTLNIFKEAEGTSTVVGTVKAGEMVGEMAFIDKKPRSATVSANSDVHLIELPITDLEAYLASQPTWLKTILTTLLMRLRAANDSIRDLSTP